jgi:hypothetical protein
MVVNERLDCGLNRLIRDRQGQSHKFFILNELAPAETDRPKVEVLIRTSPGPNPIGEIKTLGGKVVSESRNVVGVQIDPDQLERLAAITEVTLVELPTQFFPKLDRAVVEIRLSQLRQLHPELTGRGVIIGIESHLMGGI